MHSLNSRMAEAPNQHEDPRDHQGIDGRVSFEFLCDFRHGRAILPGHSILWVAISITGTGGGNDE